MMPQSEWVLAGRSVVGGSRAMQGRPASPQRMLGCVAPPPHVHPAAAPPAPRRWAVSAAAFGTLLWRRDLLAAWCVLGSIVAAINCRVSMADSRGAGWAAALRSTSGRAGLRRRLHARRNPAAWSLHATRGG